jgi:hypothetical protein
MEKSLSCMGRWLKNMKQVVGMVEKSDLIGLKNKQY